MPIFTPVSHDRIVADIRAIAARLQPGAAWLPTFIIGIGRGGLPPAVYLSHATGLPMLSVDYSSHVEAFAGDALERLAQRTQAGDRLLFVDDINDTGGTIARLREILTAHGAVADGIRFATLIDNERSIARVDYHARRIDRAVTKDWFVFPWEAMAPDTTIALDAAAVPERTA